MSKAIQKKILTEYRLNSMYGLVDTVLNQVANFGISIVMARVWGASKLGEFSAILAIVGIASLLFNFGTQGIVGREIAKSKKKIPLYLGVGLSIRIFVSLPFIFIVSFIASYLILPDKDTFINRRIILIVYGYVLGLLIFFTGMNIKVQQNLYLLVSNTIYKTMTLLVAIGFYFFLGGFELFVATLTILCLICIVSHCVRIYTKVQKFRLRWDRRFVKILIAKSFPLLLAGMAEFLNLKLDTIILAMIVGNTDTGLYTIAAQFYLGAVVVCMILIKVYSPVFIQVHSKSAIMAYSQLKRKIGQFSLIGMMGGTALFFIAPSLIRAMYGKEFEIATSLIRLLGLAFPFVVLGKLFVYIVIAVKKEKYYMRVAWIGLAINVTGNFLLIPIWGVHAAAVTTLFTEIVVGLLTAKIVYKDYVWVKSKSKV